MSYSVRPVAAGEHGLVYNSYVKSTWERGGHNGGLSYTEHCGVVHSRMERLLGSQPIALCVVSSEAPGWVGGWIIGHATAGGHVIHWIYVKHTYRRRGFGRMLLSALRGGANGELAATNMLARWRELADAMGVVMRPLNRVLEGAER